ncbi:MAG: hypothetical protein WEC35_04520 [Nitrosopumilaceae archaeon]
MTKRRGLTSVVGAVFAIIAIITAIGYVTYSMNLLEKFNQSVLVRTEESIDRGKEDFDIAKATVVNDKLNITVQNTATLPVHITRLWIENTTVSDSVFKYNIDEVVPSGRTVRNIGQNIAFNVDDADSYNIKLVTERGNSQQFTLNSVSSALLNIQLLALPPTVPSGFKTQLVMTVTNNGSGTVTNIVPVLNPVGSPTATCTPDPVSPSSYDTLAPGSTAIFSWAVKVTGTEDAQTCKYRAKLQNGYLNNFSEATITNTIVTLAATNYAANAGVLTIDYTSFSWAQTNSWNSGWQFPNGRTGFSITLANNNQTSGGYKLWISENSQMFFQAAGGTAAPTSFYIVNSVNLNPGGANVTKYTPDGHQSIANKGGTATVYFGSKLQGGKPQGGTIQDMPAGEYVGFIVLYGKFAINQGDTGTQYAQTIPFVAVIST